MQKNSIAITSIALITLSTISISCVKSISSNGEAPTSEAINTFNFATTGACPIKLNFGLKDYSILIEVYTENPMITSGSGDEAIQKKHPTLQPVYKAITTKEGIISETMELPLAIKTVYLYTDYFGIPSVIPVAVTETGVNFTLSETAKTTMQTRATAYTTKADPIYPYPKGIRVLGGWDLLGVPDYRLPTRAAHPAGLLYDLNQALPGTYAADKKPSVINTYLAEETELNLHIIKPTRLTMVFAHETGTKLNSIGYFHYPTNNPPKSVADIQPILAFPNCSYPTYVLEGNSGNMLTAGNLASGDQIALQYWDGTKFVDEFPVNTSVGFLLFDSAFKEGAIQENRNIFYSISKLNNEPDPFRQHCIAFESKSRNLVAYTFEDALRAKQANQFYTGGNFRDDMFYIKPSADAPFNTGNMLQLPESENPEPKPNENTLTYSGILAFEDVWPYMGDYDMNDVVIEYHATHYRNTNNRVLRIVDKITFKHRGGAFTSGFGYQFSKLSSNQIQQVRVTPNVLGGASVFKTDEKGLEAGNEATVVLFDNTQQVAVGTVFSVETIFAYPQIDKDIVPPYNPFIVINTNKGRGHELHLPNYAPTQLMDKTLLGMGHDKSDPGKNIFFASSAKYPFAIKIPQNTFAYPAEKQNISEKYPQFINWVESKGTTNSDWYLHPNK